MGRDLRREGDEVAGGVVVVGIAIGMMIGTRTGRGVIRLRLRRRGGEEEEEEGGVRAMIVGIGVSVALPRRRLLLRRGDGTIVRRLDREAGEDGGVRVIVAMGVGVGVGVRAETEGGGDDEREVNGCSKSGIRTAAEEC